MRIRFIGAILLTALMAPVWGQTAQRPATVAGKPNLNGIWQAINTAYWNLEAHSAEAIDQFWGMGAIAAIPAGQSVVRGGTIPYKPEALAKRNQNRANWPEADPEAKCYMLGVPRMMYHNMPFQIFQGDGDMLIAQPFAESNRIIWFTNNERLPVESWMGKSFGKWEGNTLVVTTYDQNDQTWLDRAGNFHSEEMVVTERFTLIDRDHIRYEATIADPQVFTRPWTIEMVLYRVIEDNARLLEHKCVPFADKLLYSDLLFLEKPPKVPVASK
jgi:hypothetical protein